MLIGPIFFSTIILAIGMVSFTVPKNPIERYGAKSPIEQYSDKIKGALSCHDRVVIQGILPGFCFAEGMTSHLCAHKIRIFDYPHFAEPMRDAIRNNAEALATNNGIEIEFIRKSHIRKEDIISKILERRSDHPGRVLRIETTVNDPSFFKHHRWVEQKNGQKVFKLANLKKSIYSLHDLQSITMSANKRYLAFISEIDNPSAGQNILDQVTVPKEVQGRTYKGINFFSANDQNLCEIIVRGEFSINGLRNKDLRHHLADLTVGQISCRLKNLRVHGRIKRVGRTYKYYITDLGRRVIATALALKELFIVPHLAKPATM